MPIRLLAAALAALAVLQTQPTIRSGVDLIRLDVFVVDKSGKAVSDLRSEDFSVRIDGKPRTVSFATFYGSEGRTLSAPPPPASAVSTFATNVTSTTGRTVVFVVDLESLSAGSEKVILETAGKLIDALGPSDSVGLLAIPGKAVELTLDHARVKAALESLRGIEPQSRQRHAISILEADAFGSKNLAVIAMVIQRECKGGDLVCRAEVEEDAKLLLFESNRRIDAILSALITLNVRFRSLETPKSIVLVSAGLPFTTNAGEKMRELQRRTAEAGTSTYVVHVEQTEFDARRARLPGISSLPRSDLALGLTSISGATRGEYYSGVGRATGVFERVQIEVSNSYQLGIESNAGDADGRTHKIDVQVSRSGFTVKSRKELMVSNTPRPARSPVEILAVPTLFSEAPITASTYTTRGEEPSSLKVIVLLQLLSAAGGEPLPAYAISITNAKDEQVFVGGDKISSSSPLGARAVSGVQLGPGQYRLRAAVVDSSGRAGSIDMPLSVGLRPAGPFQASDLMLGEFTDRFAPATHLSTGTPITALLELYGSDPVQLDNVGVDLELRKSDGDDLLGRGEATVAETSLRTQRAAAGQLPTTGLAPGEYDVSAIIRNGAVRVAIISRKVALKAR
jgi:VWFA-related protein